jgi:uncharacterized protein YjbI with pentapeptide repeats
VAFRYWLLAIALDLPEPKPRHVNLAGANLYGLHIRGRSTDRRLNLARASFQGCNLRGGARVENVDLTDADLSGVRGEAAEFSMVRAPRINIADADLTGSLWRRSDGSGMTGVDSASLQSCRWLGCRLDETVLPHLLAAQGTVSCPQRPNDSKPSGTTTDVRTFEGHSSSVWSCAFSPDGKSILSASDHQTVKLWDAQSGECLMTLLNGRTNQQATVDLRHNRILWASDEA